MVPDMMSSYSSKDFTKLLGESDYFGTGVEFDWLFQLGKESTLVQLMCQYVGSDNTLEEEEIESYLEWTANNVFEDVPIPGDNNSDSFWGDCDVSGELSAEIEASKTLIDCLKKRAKQLKSLLGPAQDKSTRRQLEYEKALQRCKEAEKGCSILTRRLFDSHLQLAQDLEQLALPLNYDTSCEAEHRYLAHYPLDELRQYRKCSRNSIILALENLSKELASMQKTAVTDNNISFKDMKSNQNKELKLITDDDEMSYTDILKKIDFFVGSLVEANVELMLVKIDQESNMASKEALTEILQEVSRGNGIPWFGGESEKGKAFDMSCFEKIKAVLHEAEQDNIVARLMDVFLKECKFTEARLDLKIDRLREIVGVVREQNELTCLVGILLQLDTVTVKNMEELWHCYILSLTDNADQVVTKLNQPESTFVCRNESSLTPRVSPPRGYAPERSLSGLQATIIQQNCSIAFKQEEISSSVHHLFDFLTQKKQITNKLEEYVIFGATRKPVIVDYKYLSIIEEHKHQYQNNHQELRNAHATIQKMEISRAQKPGSWTRRLMWVPFLNDNVERLEGILRGEFSAPEIKYKHIGSQKKVKKVVKKEI